MMRTKLIIVLFLILYISQTQAGRAVKVDKDEMADKVKKEFLHAWNNYKQYAWGHDELKPLSKTYHDWNREPLLMTPIDAFDTMVLMGLKDEAADAKKLIFEKLSFDKDFYVSNFETTIRLLGGLLSAYQLDGDKKFLELADDLGKRLLPVFNSKTGMPYPQINLKTGQTKNQVSNPAEIGTLLIEFGTLSKLTGNPVYYDKAKKAVTELFNRRSAIGLVGTMINVETGEWTNKESHISGMIDSYLEYLLKAWLLFGDKDCKEMWIKSIAPVNKYLADNCKTGFWYGHADMEKGKITSPNFGALDAFFPAVLVLGGDLKRAEKLQNSCFKMWSKFGIEPEQLNYKTMTALDESYVLRPEIVESAYYLYHYTRNVKYLEMGKEMFENLVKYCRTPNGYASLKSVVTKEKRDGMESFFFAETLKYFFLLFAPEKTLKFDSVIFNTEAHPIVRFVK